MGTKPISMLLLFVFAALSGSCFGDIERYSEISPTLPGIKDNESTNQFWQVQDVKKVLFIVNVEDRHEHLAEMRKIFETAMAINDKISVKFPGSSVQEITDTRELEEFYVDRQTDSDSSVNRITAIFETVAKGTHIWILADNQPKEDADIDQLADIILTRQLKLDVVMFQNAQKNTEFKGDRFRRQAVSSCGTNVYQCIAQQSGGTVITTDKNHIASVANLLKQSLKANTVHIKRFTYKNPVGSKFKFPVDETMSEVTVLIRVVNKTAAPVAFALQPSGAPAVGKQEVLGLTLLLLTYNITQISQYGLWQVQKLDMDIWDVTINAQSPVDFTYEFLEPGPGGYGEYPIQGRPIAGQSLKLMVTVPQYEMITGVLQAFFEDEFFTPFDFLSMKNVGGRRGKSMFYAQITVPTKMFRIAIQGVDKSYHMFRRLQLGYEIPVSFKLYVPSSTDLKLYTNETLKIPLTVENTDSVKQDIDVEISDDKAFALQPLRVSASINPGNNFTGYFELLAGLVIGETTTITLTAKGYVRGHITIGQFEIRRLTVEERPSKPKDPFPPTCKVLKVTGTCDIGSDLCQCVNERWSMQVEIGDVGFGLRDVFPTSVGPTHRFTVDRFPTPGYNTSLGTVRATLEDDCCHQTASISAIDMPGNSTSCFPNITANFKPPDFRICNHTTPLNITVNATSIQTFENCDQIFPCDCHNKTWRLRVEFDKTNNNNLYQAFTVGAGHNSTMTHINSQTVEVETDCCHRHVTVSATDVAGNIGQVNVTMSRFTDCNPSTSSATTVTTTTQPTTPPPTTSRLFTYLTQAVVATTQVQHQHTAAPNPNSESNEKEHFNFKYNGPTNQMVILHENNCYIVSLSDSEKVAVHTNDGLRTLELKILGLLGTATRIEVQKTDVHRYLINACGHNHDTYYRLSV